MGGKDGSRGYLYQALVAVLDAIEKDDWIEVYLEYETDNDKVDIAFKDTNENLEVIQVKSSINNFSKSDINKWLIELIEDKPNANKFKLELIGTGESNTTKYINSIKKISKNKSDKTSDEISQTIPELILSNVNKVDIEILNNDMGSFEKSIGFTIYKLLDANGYSVPAKMIDLIVGGITYQFNKLCTSGDFVSRDEFIENILEWASYNYALNRENNIKKYFDIKYYYGNQFYDKLDEDIGIDINEKDKEVKKLRLEIEDIYKDIKFIDIRYKNKKEKMRALGFYTPIEKSLGFTSSISSSSRKARLSAELQDNIIGYFNSIGIEIYEDFFNLRNLMIKNNIYFLDREELLGNEELKNKYLLLKELGEKIEYINKYEDIREYFDYLSKYKILPLSIKNISSRYLEDITLNLKIPKNICILNKDNINLPDEFIIKDITEVLDKLLCGIEDSNIKSFSRKRRINNSILGIESNEEKFIEFIDYIFEYKIFNNEEDYTILQCNFKGLKPHEAMYLPMNLMIKSNDSFKIEYSINCKNMSKIQNGKIQA